MSVKSWNHYILSWAFSRRNFFSIWRKKSPMKSSIMTLKWIHEKNSHSFFCLFCCNWFHEKTLSKFHFALLQSVSREKKSHSLCWNHFHVKLIHPKVHIILHCFNQFHENNSHFFFFLPQLISRKKWWARKRARKSNTESKLNVVIYMYIMLVNSRKNWYFSFKNGQSVLSNKFFHEKIKYALRLCES